jgi:uroporphyrinogen-III synthase
VPKKESSQGLIEEFSAEGGSASGGKKIDIRNKKIFMPRSDISDKNLSKGLEALGADVTASFAYRNIMPEDLPDLNLEFFNEIMFTSPSTVRNFRKRYGRVPMPKGIKVSCIGDVTRKEWRG